MTNVRGLFFLFGKPLSKDKGGVGEKVKSQIRMFNEAGLDCREYVWRCQPSKINSFLYRIPFTNIWPTWRYDKKFENIDYIYMRRPYVMTIHMRYVLRKIKKRNPKIKIVVEIPTFPYDKEYNGSKLKQFLLWKDQHNRIRMQGCIDYYATLTDDDEIFGLPTLKIKNGIDLNKIKPRKPIVTSGADINICAIAMFKFWHGYERFLYGLEEYYKTGGKRNIIAHFAGEGSELSFYKRITAEKNLEDHIVFHGFLTGSQLDDLYNKCRLTLGSFGCYKKNCNFSCSLKSREAVARGIPMVTGCPTDIFRKNSFKYFLEFPNNSSPLDINVIIKFYDLIYKNESEETVIKNIRNFAEQNVDMNECMKNVINYFKT